MPNGDQTARIASHKSTLTMSTPLTLGMAVTVGMLITGFIVDRHSTLLQFREVSDQKYVNEKVYQVDRIHIQNNLSEIKKALLRLEEKI